MVTKQTKSEFRNDLLWQRWIEAVEKVLHKTIAWRFKWVLWGMLFAVGRKTISSWIRAAEVQEEYQRYYYAVSSLGRQAQKISEVTLDVICRILEPIAKEQGYIEIVLDDSPTKRYCTTFHQRNQKASRFKTNLRHQPIVAEETRRPGSRLAGS